MSTIANMVVINPHDHVPIYQQLANGLRDQITGGAIAPGDALPSTSALCLEHGLGRPTVSRALAVLLEEGLITIKQGIVPTVRHRIERQSVALYAGDRLTIRMPSRPERLTLGLEAGIPMLEIERGSGDVEKHRADTVEVTGASKDRRRSPPDPRA
jgi:GntR family transcriptional regulator